MTNILWTGKKIPNSVVWCLVGDSNRQITLLLCILYIWHKSKYVLGVIVFYKHEKIRYQYHYFTVGNVMNVFIFLTIIILMLIHAYQFFRYLILFLVTDARGIFENTIILYSSSSLQIQFRFITDQFPIHEEENCFSWDYSKIW